MKKILFTSLMMLMCFTLLLGFIYPVIVWAVSGLAFPWQAKGSLVAKGGVVVGSSIIGQKFTSARYFHARPSAVDFNAGASGGSNLGPSNPDLVSRIINNADAEIKANPGQAEKVPGELVCASSSGLDPHITKEAAMWQVKRVAKARALDEKKLGGYVEKMAQKPLFGFIGPEKVNVLELNMYLDSGI